MIPTTASEPFFKRGSVIDGCGTAEEAIRQSGLDYTVAKVRLIAAKCEQTKEGIECIDGNVYHSVNEVPKHLRNSYLPNTHAIVRTDNGVNLTQNGNTVTSKYTIVQNIDAFDIMDNCIADGQATFQTAGSFGRGEEVFITAKFPSYTKGINGDEIEDYVVMKLSHDGSGGITVFMSPIRVVCQNTLHLALRKAESKITFKHTTNVHYKLKNLETMLGAHKDYSERLMYDMEALKSKKISYTDTIAHLNKIMVTPSEVQGMKISGSPLEVINKRKANLIEEIISTIDGGVGQELHRGTALWMFNGISTYYNNKEFESPNAKFSSLYGGNAQRKTQEAFDYLLTV